MSYNPVNLRGLGSKNVRARGGTVEGLETRRLLSGFTFVPLAMLNSSQLSDPTGTMVADSGGNLYFLATQGTAASNVEAVCKLSKGSSSPTVVTTFPSQQGDVGGMVIDPAGDLFGLTNTGGAANQGGVWEIPAGSTSATTLAAFNTATTGSAPQLGHNLVMDASGNLFGTAQVGGSGNGGTVWELPKGSGAITALASFAQSVSNNTPNGLDIDPSGNLFGTIGRDISVNGAHGAVWELPKGAPTLTVLASFNETNGDEPESPLVIDNSGNVFGETNAGGGGSSSVGNGTFFEIASGTGAITTLATFSGSNGELSPKEGVTADPSGNLFTQTNNGVFELPKGSSTVMPVTSFTFTSTGTNPGTPLLADASGNLFGSTVGGGSGGGGVIFELTPGGGTVTGTSPLTGTLSGKLPATGIAGQKVNLTQTLTVTNSGSSTLSGTARTQFFLSTGTGVDSSSIPLGSASRTGRLRPNALYHVRLQVTKLPASTPADTYHVVAQTTDPSGNTSTAASTGTVTVEAPRIDLSGAFVKTPVPAKNGRTTLTFTVNESGNIPAVGPLTFNIDRSSDGTLSGATVLSTLTRRINIPAGRSMRMTVTLTLPAGSYFPLIQLDPQNAFGDVNLANNSFATSTMVTVP